MRSAPPAVFAAALFATGCTGSRDVPPVTVTTPPAAPAAPATAAAAPSPEPTPPPSAPASCTDPGARFRGDKHAPMALTPQQEKQVAASEAYVHDHPSPADATGKAELASYRYARARAFFEAQHWVEAAVAFREVAMDHADADVGIYASELYLESIHMLATETTPERSVCYDQMERDVPVFLGLYCKGPSAKQNVEQCTVLRKIQRDVERLGAQRLFQRAETASDAPAKYEEAAVSYLALMRRCLDEARASGTQPQQDRCDELAYNAGNAFIKAGKVERAREVAKILMDPRNGMEKSPLAAQLAKKLKAIPVER